MMLLGTKCQAWRHAQSIVTSLIDKAAASTQALTAKTVLDISTYLFLVGFGEELSSKGEGIIRA